MIFDCNVHPTVNGKWYDGRDICNFKKIEEKLIEANFRGAAAVGLPNIGSYSDNEFIDLCKKWKWIPIAAWQLCNNDSIKKNISNIKLLGYRGIKIHPRLMRSMPSIDTLIEIFHAASMSDLCVMFCSYPCYSADRFEPVDILSLLQKALREAPKVSLMLMHSGGPDLMRYIEFARSNPQIYLDLSFTLMKYAGSSIDLDIAYAFKKFDQRIVIGSDYPEYTFDDLRARFNKFSVDIPLDKLENIAWRNAYNFFSLENLS